MNPKTSSILMCLLVSTVLAACGPFQAMRNAQATQIAADIFATQTAVAPPPTHTPTVTPTFTPTPPPPPTLTPTPAPLTVTDIFARLSPSIAFIETPIGTGSGVLIEDNYIITNAHVVWPFQKVRVVFPDGTEYPQAPVENWDLVGDLAVIRLLNTTLKPVTLGNGESLDIGSNVFLIGYPGEVERFPKPTITRGLISRLREWEPLKLTYFQTDATIAGGQSGGALVSETGEVIGISGLSFSEADFGLIVSAADALPRVQKLIAGEYMDSLGDRRVPLTGGQPEYKFVLTHHWDTQAYVINEPIGTEITLKLEGENDGGLSLIDSFGNRLISTNQGFGQAESGSATTQLAGPHFVMVNQFVDHLANFQINSNHPLIPYNDPDDGANITDDHTFLGGLDYPGDVDYLMLDLVGGEVIDISVDSASIDPLLGIDYLGATDKELISDDNSGGGLFGLNAKLTYQAPHTGRYNVIIEDGRGSGVGGYFLTVAPAPPGATPLTPPPTPTPITSPVGPMVRYESTQHPFAIQYPAAWQENPTRGQFGITTSFLSDEGALFITEEDLKMYGVREMTLDEYAEEVLSGMESMVPEFQLVSQYWITTPQGFSAEVIDFTAQEKDNFLRGRRLIYLHEGRIGFSATYFAPQAQYEELYPVIDFSFNTFQVTK